MFALRASVILEGSVCALTVSREKIWPPRTASEVASSVGENIETFGGSIGRLGAAFELGLSLGEALASSLSVEAMSQVPRSECNCGV